MRGRIAVIPVTLLLSACSSALLEPAADPELTEVSYESALSKALGGVNGTSDYCTGGGCLAGEGDCDSNRECAPGLACGIDNGPRFGMPAGYDVCWPPTCTDGILDGDETTVDSGGSCGTVPAPPTCDAPNATSTTCTDECKCAAGWGDCDSDDQCQAGLLCGTDNGPRFGMPEGYDVCWPVHCQDGVTDADETGIDCGGSCGPCLSCTAPNGTPDTCTAACKCDVGGGDCDSDAQCLPGLVCGSDNGVRFGMPTTYDVCWPAHCQNGRQDADETGVDEGGSCGIAPKCTATNGGPSSCTPECPCSAGWGDCDSNADCMPGLVCGIDNGPQFGMPAGYDVCVPRQ